MADDRALVLGMLLALFALRVGGQLAVVLFRPRWLPPLGQWQSGLLPYPVLLAAQLMLIALMSLVVVGLARGAGPLAVRHRELAPWLFAASGIYAGGMVLRYAIRMTRRPDQRWLGGTIPIVFHLVLATYLLVLATYEAG